MMAAPTPAPAAVADPTATFCSDQPAPQPGTGLTASGLPVIGARVWVIADGWIPGASTGPEPEMTSHDSACMLNACDTTAQVEITVYFHDRDPAGPYSISIPARRVHHQRLNDLTDPETLPRAVDYSMVFRSTVPIIVQHTRLDSRQAANALMSTIAYPGSP